MIELRKDYILNRWSYISINRGKRPKQFNERKESDQNAVCYFCPGNENLTPPEIGRIKNKDGWKIRWFPNKFPAVDKDSADEIATGRKYYTSGGAFGYHEIIVETPNHEKQLANLSVEEIQMLLEVYSMRIKELGARSRIKYVQIFKNNGAEAGTSLVHSHTQIIATNIVPKLVVEEVEAAKRYKNCPYCDIVKMEEKSERFIYANDDFVCFAPYAPRFNWEAWIFPTNHYRNITELDSKKLENLAKSFKIILSKLDGINASYNFFLHYSPKGENLHFHFEIVPRMNTWAGFELASDSYVITISPEDAAKFYREER